MKLTIENTAASWYKDELNLVQGDYVRFFVRYGGSGTFQPGLSLGVVKDSPEEVVARTEAAGITFFVEEKDLWYFDEHNLHVQFNEKYSEPEFEYTKN